MILIFIKSLLLTILIEVFGAYLFKVKDGYDYIFVVLINCVTNPLLNLIMDLFFTFYNNVTVLCVILFLLEALVVFVEYKFYLKFLDYDKNCLKLSLILNVLSFGSGIVLNFFSNSY